MRRLSQAALARRCGLSQGAIASYESGTRKNPAKLLAIATALEVNPWWLSAGQGAMLPAPSGIPLHDESTWPFESISPQLFWSLSLPDRRAAEQMLTTFIESVLRAGQRK